MIEQFSPWSEEISSELLALQQELLSLKSWLDTLKSEIEQKDALPEKEGSETPGIEAKLTAFENILEHLTQLERQKAWSSAVTFQEIDLLLWQIAQMQNPQILEKLANYWRKKHAWVVADMVDVASGFYSWVGITSVYQALLQRAA